MIQKILHTRSSIRFRRWSRVNYAAFASLSREVTIGVLGFSVGEKSLLKSNVLSPVFGGCQAESEVDDREKEADVLVAGQLDAFFIQVQNTDIAAAVAGYYIYFIPKRLNQDVSCFNRFFYFLFNEKQIIY